MARYQHLPIWRAAMDLALGLEQAAAGFPRVHRYSLGAELRRSAQQILGGVMRCARATSITCHREARFAGRERHDSWLRTKPEIASSPSGLLSIMSLGKSLNLRGPHGMAFETDPMIRHRERGEAISGRHRLHGGPRLLRCARSDDDLETAANIMAPAHFHQRKSRLAMTVRGNRFPSMPPRVVSRIDIAKAACRSDLVLAAAPVFRHCKARSAGRGDLAFEGTLS